nr:MAG TPA: hypothetical protein [Caudoviricetes sp.]
MAAVKAAWLYRNQDYFLVTFLRRVFIQLGQPDFTVASQWGFMSVW